MRSKHVQKVFGTCLCHGDQYCSHFNGQTSILPYPSAVLISLYLDREKREEKTHSYGLDLQIYGQCKGTSRIFFSSKYSRKRVGGGLGCSLRWKSRNYIVQLLTRTPIFFDGTNYKVQNVRTVHSSFLFICPIRP